VLPVLWNIFSRNIPVPYLRCGVKLIVARCFSEKRIPGREPELKDTPLAARRESKVESLGEHAAITLDQILTDRCARKAFDKLCSKGADRSELEQRVLTAAHVRGFRGYDPVLVPGIARSSLEKLPADIQGVANEMTLVARNPNLYSLAEEDYVRKLVEVLQRYADDLEAKIKTFRSFLRKHPRHYDMQSVTRRELLRYVQKATGRPRYGLVADILSGAPTVGREQLVVDASSLRKLYTNPRRTQSSSPNPRKRDFLPSNLSKDAPHTGGSH